MTIFQKFFGRTEGICSQFLKNNPPEIATGDELENARKIVTFTKVILSPLRENYDLFELKSELTKFRDSLSVSAGASINSLTVNTESKKLSNELTDLINAIDTFVLYYSAIEERIDRYIRKNEGTWTAAGRELVINLGWVYTAKKESERANRQRESHWVLTLKNAAERGLVSLQGSKTLQPSLQVLIAELPDEDYFHATKIEKSQQASVGYTFKLYKEKMETLLNQASLKEPAWGPQIEEVSQILKNWPSEKTSILDLLELRDAVHKACADKLVGYYSSQICITMTELLRELPSARYEKNTDLLAYKYIEPKLSMSKEEEKAEDDEITLSEKTLNAHAISLPQTDESAKKLDELTVRLNELMQANENLEKEKKGLASDNEALREVNDTLVKKQATLTPTYGACSASTSSESHDQHAANKQKPVTPKRNQKSNVA